jgi:hypothetical protein
VTELAEVEKINQSYLCPVLQALPRSTPVSSP